MRDHSTSSRRTGLWLTLPAVAYLAVGSLLPLGVTLYFSSRSYNLLTPEWNEFAGWDNYLSLAGDPMFWTSSGLTVLITVCVLALTLGGGVLLAILLDQDFPGRSIARCLAIAPFFVMPTVSALVWKHLLMHPVYGVFARINEVFGLRPIDWFSSHPLLSLIMILTWEWLPFALLILLTALQSLDREQLEAAQMDGAGLLQRFWFILLPHLGRAIGVVALMETLFLLGLFAEIFVTTAGGPGTATTHLPYYIYSRALLQFDIGGASAGAVAAVVLANLGAAFLARFALAKETA